MSRLILLFHKMRGMLRLCIPFQFSRDSRVLSLWILACGLVAAATIPAWLVSVRYLAPLGWLGLLSIAIVAQHVVLFLRQSNESPSVVSTSNEESRSQRWSHFLEAAG